MKLNNEKVRIFSLDVDLISYKQSLVSVLELAKKREPSYVCFANVHMVIEAYKNSKLATAVNNSALVLTDGKPISFSCKLVHNVYQERIAGMDFMPSIINECQKHNLSIFLFGSTNEVLDKLVKEIKKNSPSLRIAGSLSPVFGEFTPQEAQYYIETINSVNPNVVLVGLGCPKQEMWMARYSKEISAVLLGVGGAFSVYAGLSKRAPLWMQKFSLEWFYRLIQEPKRMWKRYLYTNSMFIWLILKNVYFKNFRDNKRSS